MNWLRLAELQLCESRWSAGRGKDQRAIGNGDQIDVGNDGRVNGDWCGCSDLSRAGIGIRHHGVLGYAESFSQALIVGEEEELILSVVANCRTAFAEVWQQDWTAHSSAKLIALKRRYGLVGIVKVVLRVQHGIAQELKEISVQVVSARLADCVDNAPHRATIFGRSIMGNYLDFLDRFHAKHLPAGSTGSKI